MEENNEQMPIQKKMNSYALSSFVLALVGILVAGIPCGIAAVITGGLGLAKYNPEKQKNNKWMAIVGIVLGIIDIVLVVTFLPTLYKQLGIM